MKSLWPNLSDPIPRTAQIVAAKRAIEQFHPSPLFKDPYASVLAGDEVNELLSKWQEIAKVQLLPLEQVIIKRTRYIVIRTKFIDDYLNAILSQADYKQVVILGAGLDTRVYRFAWPSCTTVYEVDCSEILHYKTQILQDINPTCNYQPIPGDLAASDSEWATSILNAGYQACVPTIWLIEGVSMYLKEAEVHLILQRLSELSLSGSILVMDGVKEGSILAGQRAKREGKGRVIPNWKFGTDHPKQLLARYGWTAVVNEPQDIGGGYGRYPKSMPIGTDTDSQDDGRGVWIINAMKKQFEKTKGLFNVEYE